MTRCVLAILCIIVALGTLILQSAAFAHAQDVVVIKVWYHQYGEDGVQDAVNRYADEYNKLNPKVQIQVSWIPGDYGTKLNIALVAAQGPDVFEGQPNLGMVRQGIIAPLDDLYTSDTLKDFNPNNIMAATVDGKIYGVKMIDDTGAFYYRKSVLDKAGIKPPRTIDELIAAAKALTSGNQKGLFIGNDGGANSTFGKFVIWSAGNDITRNGKVGFDNDRSVLALTKLKKLYDSGALLIGAPTDWYDPSVFIDGLAPIQFAGLWSMPAIKVALGDDFGVFPWPALDDQGTPSTWYGGWTAFVSTKSQHIDEAKAFVKWLWIDSAKDQLDFNVSYGFHTPTNECRRKC
ncbi:MAG: sugar ABC transporter substrate-binding protein [Chloroflexota bacterium]